MKRIHYNKLVRDKIPSVIKKNGGSYKVKRLSTAAFQRELLAKVGEEASALPRLRKKDGIASELGDVLDVITEIQKTFRISSVAVKREQRKSMKRKGGFTKRLYLYWAEDTGYRTNERRNAKR